MPHQIQPRIMFCATVIARVKFTISVLGFGLWGQHARARIHPCQFNATSDSIQNAVLRDHENTHAPAFILRANPMTRQIQSTILFGTIARMEFAVEARGFGL